MSLSWSAARTPASLSYSASDDRRDRPEGRSRGGQGHGEHVGGTGEPLRRCSDGLGTRYTREQGDKRGEAVGVVGASAEPGLSPEKWLRWKVLCKEYRATIQKRKKKSQTQIVFIPLFYTCSKSRGWTHLLE